MLQISESERTIMEVLWNSSPSTSKAILEQLSSSTEWHENTVRTMLSRLLKKGIVTSEKLKREYLYSPSISREVYINQQSNSLITRLFHGKVSPLIASFAKQDLITENEIGEIEKILAELKKGLNDD